MNENLKLQLKDLDKKLVLYSKKHTYDLTEYGENTVYPDIQKTTVEITDDFNVFKMGYKKNVFYSKESLLSIDILRSNK